MKIWVITREENDYDQYGEYFVTAFLKKPTREQIIKLNLVVTDKSVNHILNGGGREEYEQTWFHLREFNDGEELPCDY